MKEPSQISESNGSELRKSVMMNGGEDLHRLHDVALKELSQKMADFASERDWEKFHSPRNLLLALVGEVGELSEIFQWRGEVPKGLPDWDMEEKEHLGEELSDVLLYLLRLADICDINLGEAALRKLTKNAIKYPVERCRGSSGKKYAAYNKQAKREMEMKMKREMETKMEMEEREL